jgi:hypothetical protein
MQGLSFIRQSIPLFSRDIWQRWIVQRRDGEYSISRLVGRHANYHIMSKNAAERWLVHMTGAINDHE